MILGQEISFMPLSISMMSNPTLAPLSLNWSSVEYSLAASFQNSFWIANTLKCTISEFSTMPFLGMMFYSLVQGFLIIEMTRSKIFSHKRTRSAPVSHWTAITIWDWKGIAD